MESVLGDIPQLSVQEAESFQALCSFCGWSLYVKPTEDALEKLIEERQLFAESPFTHSMPEPSEALFTFLCSLAQAEDEKAKMIKEVSLDHTYLFLMVGQSRTSPFESVYRTDDSTMFGPTTLQVRDVYRQWGLKLEREGSQPDDHVGIEFLFVAHLFSLLAQEIEAGNEEKAAEITEAIRNFLADHLLVFAPTYLGNVEVRAKSLYFRSIATMSSEFLHELSEFFDVEPQETIDEKYKLSA